jgi:hypothetical protein
MAVALAAAVVTEPVPVLVRATVLALVPVTVLEMVAAMEELLVEVIKFMINNITRKYVYDLHGMRSILLNKINRPWHLFAYPSCLRELIVHQIHI